MEPTNVFVFGDSHAMIFCDGDTVFDTLSLIDLHQIATSISGLNNPESKLKYGEFIKARLPLAGQNDYALFKLGAVDMEYIYFYKRCVAKKELSVEEFSDGLVVLFAKFLLENRISERTNVIVAGLHLPSYASDEYIQWHIPKICVGIENCDQARLLDVETRFRSLGITRATLTANNLMLNRKLRALCERLGVLYFDTTALFMDPATGLLREEIIGAPPPGHRYYNNDHHYKSICDRSDRGPQIITRRALDAFIKEHRYSRPPMTTEQPNKFYCSPAINESAYSIASPQSHY